MSPYLDLGILSFSDVHLLHKNTKTEDTLRRLDNMLYNHELMLGVRLIVIVGDLFETLGTLPDNRIGPIQQWIINLLRLCKKRSIVLRVLEGTPSHDAKQSRQFEILNQHIGIHADVRHVTEVEIEKIESLNINILYIPDEIDDTTAITQSKVKALLSVRGLSHVDITLVHGFFEFQVPKHVTSNVHNSKYYSKITKYAVFCGHDHVSKKYYNIHINGSFDGLRHGEEHSKGCWFVNIKGKVTTSKFYVNEDAERYVTVNADALSENDLTSNLNTLLDSGVKNIRVLATKSSGNYSIALKYKNLYKGIRWTIESTVTKINAEIVVKVFKPVTISKTTLRDAVSNKLTQMQVNTNQMSTSLDVLNRIMVE